MSPVGDTKGLTPMGRSDIDLAERVVRRRAWAAILLGALFMLSQALSLGDPPLGSSEVTHLAAWFLWAAAFALFLGWSTGLFRGRTLMGLINDEGTIEHRRRALGTGFWSAVIAAFMAYWASFYEPIAVRDACRLIVTFAAAPALIRFGWLELRALRDG